MTLGNINVYLCSRPPARSFHPSCVLTIHSLFLFGSSFPFPSPPALVCSSVLLPLSLSFDFSFRPGAPPPPPPPAVYARNVPVPSSCFFLPLPSLFCISLFLPPPPLLLHFPPLPFASLILPILILPFSLSLLPSFYEHKPTQIVHKSCVVRKREEYYFKSTVSEERTH